MPMSAGRIVVGVDGSAPSRAALRWAVEQARLTGGTVEAVIAWQLPLMLMNHGSAPIYREEETDFADEARKRIDAVISEEVTLADSHLVTTRVVHGHPAQVLLDAADRPDLLVVGSRGHGGFAGALLGSVSQHCVQHAHCPVLIVR
jgi:nucleotide-binding universal stress UspA family protein